MVSCYFIPVIIEFSKCIDIYSSAKFELVNLVCCSVYGLECLRCLYKSTLKELGYDKKQIKDILRHEEEQAVEEYIKENEAKKGYIKKLVGI